MYTVCFVSCNQFSCSWEGWECLAEEAQDCFRAVLMVLQSSFRAGAPAPSSLMAQQCSLPLNNLQDNNPPPQTQAIITLNFTGIRAVLEKPPYGCRAPVCLWGAAPSPTGIEVSAGGDTPRHGLRELLSPGAALVISLM